MKSHVNGAELDIGFQIPPVVKEITQEKINNYAEASEDFNPIHVDEEFAAKSMFKGTIAHGLLSLAYISEMMSKWLGKGWLAGGQLEVTFLVPVRPGDTISARGTVMEKVEEAGNRYVICDVFCENQKGNKVITGKAKGLVE